MNTKMINVLVKASTYEGWADDRYIECFETLKQNLSSSQFDSLVGRFKSVRNRTQVKTDNGNIVSLPERQLERKKQDIKVSIENIERGLFKKAI